MFSIKKKNFKLDLEISKLKFENKSKDSYLKRKIEQLSELKKADIFFTHLIKKESAYPKLKFILN